jgi:formamidopyrimidine-DNA glycosylase
MPEVCPNVSTNAPQPLTVLQIGEVARIVHYLRKHLFNRTVATCQALEDDIVYGKVGTSASAFQKATEGRKVTGAAQQGKYFYVTFDKPPHAVMHFGMTGWMKFNNEDTAYYKQAKEKDAKEEEWPPRFMKFLWKFEPEKVDGADREAVEVAFVDARRLGRIRLVECEEDNIRNVTPLKENGPDPVRDKDTVTVEWLKSLMRRKKVPIKALLLDQANLSGVGNWVADEVLYQARIHPEQYCNTFDDNQIKELHDCLMSVCTIAVETLGDSTKFPETWIMKYRWDKGKKASNVLPNGEKIVHLTVGGRTSAVVPSRQKKTAAVAGDIDSDEADSKPAKWRKRKSKDEDEDSADVEEAPATKKGGRGRKKVETNGVKDEPQVNGGAEDDAKTLAKKKATPKEDSKPPTPGSRRSTRNRM